MFYHCLYPLNLPLERLWGPQGNERLCNWHVSCAANIGLFETRKWTYWS